MDNTDSEYRLIQLKERSYYFTVHDSIRAMPKKRRNGRHVSILIKMVVDRSHILLRFVYGSILDPIVE